MRAFTLIETVIYIALFSFIMSGVLLSVYTLLQGGDQFSKRNITANEGSFVNAKIDWALSDLDTISLPASGYGSTLSIQRNDGTQVDVRLVSGVVQMSINGGTYTPLTSSNISVTKLGFNTFSGTPSGVEASTTINGVTFMTRRYIRK
jgi:type II secretory pathway pseudopilin PulG